MEFMEDCEVIQAPDNAEGTTLSLVLLLVILGLVVFAGTSCQNCKNHKCLEPTARPVDISTPRDKLLALFKNHTALALVNAFGVKQEDLFIGDEPPGRARCIVFYLRNLETEVEVKAFIERSNDLEIIERQYIQHRKWDLAGILRCRITGIERVVMKGVTTHP